MNDALEKHAEYLAFYRRAVENDVTKLHALRGIYNFSRLVNLSIEKSNSFCQFILY